MPIPTSTATWLGLPTLTKVRWNTLAGSHLLGLERDERITQNRSLLVCAGANQAKVLVVEGVSRSG
jgi:hypothetical protein